jgi:hypothetical protein
MSATNALTKSVHQTATPKLRTSTILGRSQREEGQLLETHLRKTETSHPKLRHLAPLSNSYANFSVRKAIPSKTETGTLRVRASKVSNHYTSLAHSSLYWPFQIGPGSRPLRNDPETVPETFQAVSRNAETLALQMNHLREFAPETIKKLFLKRFRACEHHIAVATLSSILERALGILPTHKKIGLEKPCRNRHL